METEGTLYICATPIGNLGDVTFRVADTLREVDLIAAEDTRNSVKLLSHLGIHTPLTSYHEYNKVEKARELAAALHRGKNIALITDAGTPVISDPGEVLVELCLKEGIPVTSLPGPCACITALTLSGLSSRRFCFEGFLPYSDKREYRRVLGELKEETRTIVLYEAPHHLLRTLKDLMEAVGERRLTICRELTKRFEQVWATTLPEAVAYYGQNEPRGEYVLVLEGKSRQEQRRQEQEDYSALPIEEHMAYYEQEGLPRKEAMRLVARDRGISRRDVYQYFLGKK